MDVVNGPVFETVLAAEAEYLFSDCLFSDGHFVFLYLKKKNAWLNFDLT